MKARMADHTSNVDIRIDSERNFGIVFAVVFAVLFFWPMLGGNGPWWWFLPISLLCLALAFLKPEALRLPNRLWFRIGLVLGAITAPIVMFLVYLTTFLPIGAVLRLLGKDPLSTRIDRGADSYWVVRTERPQSMKNQF